MSSILEGFHNGELYSSLDLTRVLYSGIMVLSLRSANTERIHEEILLPASAMLDICVDQERSEQMVTPRSFTVGCGDNVDPLAVEYSRNSF